MNGKSVILGIVAEYDPFHNGHLYQIIEAKKACGADVVYVALSPCIKQRGILSMLSPFDRAACAVHEGADAVFQLPVMWTVRDAEHYALGAVALLCRPGITHISFGAETSDLQILRRTADFLDDPPSSFQSTLKSFMEEGKGYPAALSDAVSTFFPDGGRVISHPNNILGICYLRALKKMKSDVVPVIVPRRGDYHNPYVSDDSPSASAIRTALSRGNYSSAFRAMPDFSTVMIKKAFLSGRVPDPEIWNSLLTERLRIADISSLPDLSEGLEGALRKNASALTAGDNLAGSVSSRRYTASRISRLCAMAMLNVTDDRIRNLPLPTSTLLLALRKKKAPTDRWKDLPVRIAVSAADWAKTADPEELLSWRLWAVCSHLPDTLPFTEKIYTES